MELLKCMCNLDCTNSISLYQVFIFRKALQLFMKSIFTLKHYCRVRFGLILMKLTCSLSCFYLKPVPTALAQVDREKIYQWINELSSPETRENALLELSKKRESVPDLAPMLWHSFGTIAALLQVGIYP